MESVFFEVYEGLPRQAPGSRACAVRALDLCGDLPPSPRVLDLGCGGGGQTLHLTELLDGPIVAVDLHAPFIDAIRATARALGLADRLDARVADMAALPFTDATFDLVWSEGALYNLGLERALPICHDLLRPGGHLVFTDAVWRTASAPDEVRAAFADYPTMGTEADVLAQLEAGGWSVLGHFLLPDAAWWDDFYRPMEQRIESLRAKFAGAPEALAALDEIAKEPRMHRAHGHHYGYLCVVARRA